MLKKSPKILTLNKKNGNIIDVLGTETLKYMSKGIGFC